MIKLLIKILFLLIVSSCVNVQKEEIQEVIQNTQNIVETKIIKQKSKDHNKKSLEKNIFYLVGDPYFIEGVKYVPKENYFYSEVGLATYYGKELHNIRTVNNDLNKVTELLARHNTLPLPSIVKITNLENGLFITVKINDRHQDNGSIIQVSRKVAQLLDFYKNKIAKVRVEIIVDASKQWKSVTHSMNEPKFNDTVDSAPTDIVTISNIDGNEEEDFNEEISLKEKPIELGSQEIEKVDLFLVIEDFKNYEEIQNILKELEINLKNTIESNENGYKLIIGPIDNILANNLVSSFVMKGYKNTKIILE